MISSEEKIEIRSRTAKPMLWLAIISMCMIFGALTSAYMVRRADPGWYPIELPVAFYISAAIIIISSITLIFAYNSAKKDNFLGVQTGVLLTFLLGIGFIISQIMAWGMLVERNIFLVDKTNNASQYIYILSFTHLLHVIGGIIMLIYVCIKSFRKMYHSKNLLGLQLCSIYWHFLDFIWMYLLLFLHFAK